MQYSDGTYLANNADWHEEDSPYKAALVERAIDRTDTKFRTCADIGCGAGLVAELVASKYPSAKITGFDISSHAAAFWSKRKGIELYQSDILNTSEKFDLMFCLDVFEHVEDYIGFLRDLRKHGDSFVFNIPLDLNCAKILGGFRAVRETVGHLHYFNRYTALETLKLAGYEVIDSYFSSQMQSPKTLKHWMVAIPRRLPLSPDLSSQLFGGFSLVVTAKSRAPVQIGG